MPITDSALRTCIHHAGFPLERREFVFNVISEGLQNFRDYRQPRYYGARGTYVKEPTASHSSSKGRYDQSKARFILIAALYRAWLLGFGVAPTLNHKKHTDTPFATFAMDVMAREGIGRIHHHLESYRSFVKQQLVQNECHNMKSGISGGSKHAQ